MTYRVCASWHEKAHHANEYIPRRRPISDTAAGEKPSLLYGDDHERLNYGQRLAAKYFFLEN